MPPKKAKKPLSRINKNAAQNMEFYLKCWDSHETHFCQECGTELKQFNPVHISHVLSKKAFPEHKNDVRNHILMCFDCHQEYEFRNREGMATFKKAEEIRLLLINEHYKK